jgi:ATP-dependent DNA helicase RecQ
MPTVELAELLHQRFGFTSFRPGQQAVMEALMTHGAALAVFPTGAGKSLCYQLPALALDGLTLVVSPLIALMKDQLDFLVARGVRAARLDSSLGEAGAREVTAQLEAGTLQLLYVAPERFNNERFLRTLSRVRIALFAVDEAHCISEWGHNFRPDYLKIAGVRARAGRRAGAGADSHRDAVGGGRHLQELRHLRGLDGGDRLLPPEPHHADDARGRPRSR